MYKIVFVVAVFAFTLQGAFSGPVAENAAPVPVGTGPASNSNNIGAPVDKPANDVVTDTTTTAPEATTTTVAPKNGASSTEMCLLLVQVSSLALVAKHMLL
ncbi:uncharacterized protein LOC100164630 precursor [Acyrthosiphon pisum]|uniref:ACYPI005624 protein n=1 Tax=Acyrthosiphon pisum TaxID=7029 RepID=C4WRS1_ACYPI|nr:uncharacterized protein LOC100164630 precursor [Acyrthosiphon pisum]BAH70591.1 ACYPI005624 [Acyrthosiphon pisum]|eukprot:NP_001155634.2 uncharacterized protein LOC100164630 precursor [Acyrthosiphon pisum]